MAVTLNFAGYLLKLNLLVLVVVLLQLFKMVPGYALKFWRTRHYIELLISVTK
jgi:hypothetical protein